jgi:hypothetical protein
MAGGTLSRMSIFIRGAVVVALLVVLLWVMELAAKFYVVHGLRVTDRDFSRFYSSDPALGLLTWGDKYTSHPYFGNVNLWRMDELERLHENRDDSQYVIAILDAVIGPGRRRSLP